MDFNKEYKTNPKDVAEWFNFQDAEFLIAPSDTLAFRNETLRTFKMGDIREDGIAERTAYEIVDLESGIKSKTVLLDWKNIVDGEKEVPYSASKAKEYLLLSDEFRDFVDTKSNDLNVKQQDHKNEAKKK
jgi:hypothetical protein